MSAIIGGIVAYQFPQKRTLLSMRGISVISHNTIIIFLKPLSALLGEKKMVMIPTTTSRCPAAPRLGAAASAAEHLCSYAPRPRHILRHRRLVVTLYVRHVREPAIFCSLNEALKMHGVRCSNKRCHSLYERHLSTYLKVKLIADFEATRALVPRG